MHFGTKSYLKSTCNHTAKHAALTENLPVGPRSQRPKIFDSSDPTNHH
jgi:hypothetical protein